MKQEIRELEIMLDKLNGMIYRAETDEEKEKLALFHKNLGDRLQELAAQTFTGNDRVYAELAGTLKEAAREIAAFERGQKKIADVFKYLSDVAEQLDAALFGWT